MSQCLIDSISTKLYYRSISNTLVIIKLQVRSLTAQRDALVEKK